MAEQFHLSTDPVKSTGRQQQMKVEHAAIYWPREFFYERRRCPFRGPQQLIARPRGNTRRRQMEANDRIEGAAFDLLLSFGSSFKWPQLIH